MILRKNLQLLEVEGVVPVALNPLSLFPNPKGISSIQCACAY